MDGLGRWIQSEMEWMLYYYDSISCKRDWYDCVTTANGNHYVISRKSEISVIHKREARCLIFSIQQDMNAFTRKFTNRSYGG